MEEEEEEEDGGGRWREKVGWDFFDWPLRKHEKTKQNMLKNRINLFGTAIDEKY